MDFRKLNLEVMTGPLISLRMLIEGDLILPTGYSLTSETSRSGLVSASLKVPDGKQIRLHSRYDPIQEAQLLVKEIGEESSFIFLGLGLGYQVDVLQKMLPSEQIAANLMIIEPNPWMAQFAFRNRDLRHLLTDSRVSWCIGLSEDEIGLHWQQELEWSRLSGVRIIEHSPSMVINPSYFKQVKERIIVISRRSKGNLTTLMTMGDEFQRNSFENLPYLCFCPGMEELFNRFKGHPIVVVAAGPSLDKNVHLLSQIKGKVLILAVDTAFRQLVLHGIRPDIVAAADPSYENSLDFVGVENEREVILAAEIMTHPTIFHTFKGPKLVLSFGGGLMPWMKSYIDSKGIIQCWGSIATTVFDIARQLGGDPIIFLGLDLSFQDGRLHARGSLSDDFLFDGIHQYSSLEHETTSYINSRGGIRCRLNTGETLYTDKSMQLYKEWFEERFQQTTQRIVNATEGGIVQRNVIKMTFKEAIDTFCHDSLPIRDILFQHVQKKVRFNIADFRQELKERFKELNIFGQKVQQSFDAIKRLRGCGTQSIDDLKGKSRIDFEDLNSIRGSFFAPGLLYNWFKASKAKALVRFSSEFSNWSKGGTRELAIWLDFHERLLLSASSFLDFLHPLIQKNIEVFSWQEPKIRETFLGSAL